MTSVTASGGGQLTAVGYDQGARLGALYATWHGGRWTVTDGPENGTVLFGVSAAGPATWAAGANDLVPVTQVKG